VSKLGGAGEASPVQQVSVSFRILFVHALCASLGASFAIRFFFLFYAPCWYEMVLGRFVEFSMHFTYIF